MGATSRDPLHPRVDRAGGTPGGRGKAMSDACDRPADRALARHRANVAAVEVCDPRRDHMPGPHDVRRDHERPERSGQDAECGLCVLGRAAGRLGEQIRGTRRTRDVCRLAACRCRPKRKRHDESEPDRTRSLRHPVQCTPLALPRGCRARARHTGRTALGGRVLGALVSPQGTSHEYLGIAGPQAGRRSRLSQPQGSSAAERAS